MIRWGVGRVAAALVVTAVVGLVSGCALLAPPRPAPRATPTETPAAVPIAEQLPDPRVPGQTIGTARLVAVAHDPITDPVAQHPLTGDVRIVVNSDKQVEVRIRPTASSGAGLAALSGLDLLMSGKRYDGLPENIQAQSRFSLNSGLNSVDPDGELVLPLAPDFPVLDDPSFLHSIEESVSSDARVIAVASITWTMPSPFPHLKPVDHGVVLYAHGRVLMDGDTPATYIPNPLDTLYMVSRRFGLTEVQLVWLNPEMLIGASEPMLKQGIGVNLDPARR
ncbi:hypothetical protein AB4Z18_10340 [Leifsonia sp. 2TAF2]|uniref:hypothetical protein n=1 Tax=Leifsonia sp. 2TAF2 TaxID=3233009 RepID=UPI003F9E9848